MRINLKETCKLYREKIRAMERYNYLNRFNTGTKSAETARESLETIKAAVLQDKGYKAITEAIIIAEKRCKARTISTWNVIEDLIAVEDRLHITKKAMEWTTVIIDHNASTFAKAYMGMSYSIPHSTIVCAEYHNGGWILTDIRRDDCGKEKYHLRLSETAKEAILKNVERLAI